MFHQFSSRIIVSIFFWRIISTSKPISDLVKGLKLTKTKNQEISIFNICPGVCHFRAWTIFCPFLMFLLGKKKILHRRDKTLKLVLLPRLYCFDTQPANMRRQARLSHVNADGAEPKMFENQDDHIIILSMSLDIQLC